MTDEQDVKKEEHAVCPACGEELTEGECENEECEESPNYDEEAFEDEEEDEPEEPAP